MTSHLDKSTRIFIEQSVELIRQDTECDFDLDCIEEIADIIKGDLEENYPNIRVSRSDIRDYIIGIL